MVSRANYWCVVVGVVLALLGTTTVASAQKKRAPKVIELEGLVVEGKVQKPQVFYVLGRSSIRYEELELDKSFLDRIVASARSNPF